MVSPFHEYPTPSSYLVIYEDVDYGSDTNVLGRGGQFPSHMCPMPRLIRHTTAEHGGGEANAPLAQHQTLNVGNTIITNPLDEQQQLIIYQEESARRRTQLAAAL